MVAMLWFMVRGSRSTPPTPRTEHPSTVADLRREHERLGAQIENLNGEHAAESHVPSAGASAVATPGTRDTLTR